MKDYTIEISDAAKKYCSQDNHLGLTGRIFNSSCFIAGVNSEISAKIREDEAVEFAEFLRSPQCRNEWMNDIQSTSELYAIFLTDKNKTK